MEPLSATASIIAVLQACEKVVKYISTAAGATESRKRLREEVRACGIILQQLKDEADDSEEGKAWSETIKLLDQPGAPLSRLNTALDLVRTKLQPKDSIGKALRWPFQEKEVQKIIEAIEREKSLLDVALQNNSRKLIQEILKQSNENGRQLTELIELVKRSGQDNQSHLEELKDKISRVHVSQTGLQNVIDRLDKSQASRQDLERHQMILHWLTPTDYAPQQQDFISRRQAGTGQWLLNSQVYQSWSKSEKSTLFCPGIPGAGKTILTSIVIDDICEVYQDDPTVGVAYLYCDLRRQEEQRINDLLLSLLKQLAEAQNSLSWAVEDLYNQYNKKRTRPSLEDISKALQIVAASYSRVFILLDALDECQAANGCRSRLISEIFALQQKYKINLLVTSRFIPEITEKFEECEILEIRASSEDVRKYVDGHMFGLPNFVSRNAELQEQIKTGIVQSVEGMFLLAQLHLDSLVGKKSPKAIRTALEKLPTGSEAYDDAYKGAMERIEGQVADQKELAKQVLSWITCARRPLTTSELQHALGVEVGELQLDEDNFSQIEDLVSVCAGLVIVDGESDIIRLVHYTAQDYFQRTQNYWFPDAEATLTRICVTYLSFDIFKKGPCPTHVDFQERLQKNKFYDYAACNWGDHARVAPSACTEIVNFLERVGNVAASNQALFTRRPIGSWGRYSLFIKEFLDQVTGLHLAAHFGLEEAATALVRIVEVNASDARGRTPLWYAVESGHEAIVKLLLDHNAAVDSKFQNRTPLSYAVENGHEAIVKLLLDRNATVNPKDNTSLTPLVCAIHNGHEAIVKLLIDYGAAINPDDDNNGMPLSIAATRGHEAIVKMLLNSNAAANFNEMKGVSPLFDVVRSGHEAVLKLLLNNEVAVNCMDWDSRTPLSYAAQYGHEAIVKLLLSNNAAIDSQDYRGRTPLSYATEYRHETVVKLLLENNVAVNCRDWGSRTPLSYAAQYGSETIVKLLLNKNATINSPDKESKTPLSYAAENGHETVVKLLLDNKSAVVDYHDNEGRTPLSYAAENGHEAVVKLLLDSEATIAESQYNEGWTPLTYATWYEHEAIIKLLSEAGAKKESSYTK